MTKTATPPRLMTEELEGLLSVLHDADSLELKLTVPDEDRQSAVRALGVDVLDAYLRQVYFFDTPDLDLDRAGVVVRARRSQGRPDDSVVKLRPVVPGDLDRELRASDGFVIEVDAMPGAYVCSASFKGQPRDGSVKQAIAGERPLRKLFSKGQRRFFADRGPAGIELDDLAVLGPITVLKVKLPARELSRKLALELWNYPDGSRILEISTKAAPGDWFEAVTETRDHLIARGVDLDAEQTTKTRTALEYFSNLLH